MAVGTAGPHPSSVAPTRSASYAIPMTLMVTLYFSIGFITALNDILVPHFKDLFHLSNTLALLVQFCFFGAYFVMSLPSGAIVGRIGYKSGIIAALSTMGAGLLCFQPAAILISYPLFLFALFVVGSGLALLQVAINPYVGALGKPETAASRLNLCGFLNSSGATAAPKIGAHFIFIVTVASAATISAGATTAQLAHSVRAPYLLLAAFAFTVAAVTWFVPLPALIPTRESTPTQGSAWSFPHLRFGALAIFFYVGAEVAIGSIMINFLGQPSMGSLSHAAAAIYVSLYGFAAMTGRFIGIFALRIVSAERALTAVAVTACLAVLITLTAHGPLALWAIVSCGLFNSVMWPCIFPMSLKGLGPLTSQGSGILVTMVVGGAIIPEIQGLLADRFGYQPSFAIVLACYAYILFFAVSGSRDDAA